MRHTTIKSIILLICLAAPVLWCNANDNSSTDGHSLIIIKNGDVQSIPQGTSIEASIDGHTLTVVFTENLGDVTVEITTASGAWVQTYWATTPTGLMTNIPLSGDYVVSFTLPNGDEYFGEFEVTD